MPFDPGAAYEPDNSAAAVKPKGLLKAGNLDPYNRPVLKNVGQNQHPAGSVSTTYSIGIQTDEGEVVIPTVVDGKQLTNEDAIAHYKKTGEHFGIFDNSANADAFATGLHNKQAEKMGLGSGGFDPSQPYEKAPPSKFSAFMKGQEPEQRASTTLPGIVGAVTRGVAPYAAGAAAGAALGAPFAGVGAIPGAVAGAGAVALSDLASAVYNPVANLFGGPHLPSAREGTNKLLDLLHVERPDTSVERMVETGSGAAASAGGTARVADLLAMTLKNPLSRAVAAQIAARPALQTAAGAAAGGAGQAAAELGLGPLPQMLIAAAAGSVPFAGARGASATAGELVPMTPGVRVAAKGAETAQTASREILKRMGQDQTGGGPSAVDMLEQLNSTTKPLTLADVGGENLRALAGHVARQPGESRNVMKTALEKRDAGAAARLEDDIGAALGTTSVRRTAQALEKAQSTMAAPLYKDAYAANQAVESPELSKILDTPAGAKALRKAAEKMQNDRKLVGGPDPELTAMVKDLTETGLMKDPKTGVGIARGLKLQTWDYVKRSLYDQASAARRAGEKDDAAIIDGLRKDLVREIDNLDTTAVRDKAGAIVRPGKWAEARATFAGVEENKEALESGRRLFHPKVTPEEVADEFAEFSPAQREMYRLGVADEARARIAQTGIGGDEAKALLKNDWTRRKLEAVAGSPKEAERLIRAITDERAMFGTKYDVLGNSKTAAREAEDNPKGEAAIEGGKAVLHALHNNLLGAGLSAWRANRALGRLKDPAVNAAIAKILTDPKLAAELAQTYGQAQAKPGPRVPMSMLGAPAALPALTAPQNQQ